MNPITALSLAPDGVEQDPESDPNPYLDNHLPTLYQQQIHQSKYARWNDSLGRREVWSETVDRYISFMEEHLRDRGTPLSRSTYEELRLAILNQDVLPSMRALMTAGPALKRDHVAAYNCSYLAVNRPQAFDEAMYILMCGVGVGFSVERQFTNQLPEIAEELHICDDVIVVADSKIGWASAFRRLLALLYSGSIPKWDTSKVREAGARLKTFGGRASGPVPLEELFRYAVEMFRNAVGRKLTSLECHGLMCKVGDIVVVGGVRRSALISLSNPSDDRMRDAKAGKWWETSPHYALANNSAAWTERPSVERFLDEWMALIRSKSGERGIFNRSAAQKKLKDTRRDVDYEFGVNPCGEILLRDRQFCNLSQVTVRASDTHESLARKVRLATVIGTMQATLTEFRYLSPQWKRNCDEERLLGVGFTGIMDSPLLNGSDADLAEILQSLRAVAVEVNDEYAQALAIAPAAAITCVKPAGNSTQLVGAHGSGMHEAHSEYYVRRNRGSKNDPVAKLLYYQGVPCEDEVHHPESTWVFSYPMKAPEGAITRAQRSALERLEHWLVFAENWCEHNPSITISVKDEEWIEVGAWVYAHFDRMIGITFLPYSEHIYQQAPYEEISQGDYERRAMEMPASIDWSLLTDLEKEDMTEGVQELACSGGACEL